MKKLFILFFLTIQFMPTKAQITVTSLDMPLLNDTIRYSFAGALSIPNPALTGTNYTWDFSQLTANRQRLDTFVAVTSTPFIYQLYFNNATAYPNHKATYAVSVPTPSLTTGITLSNVFNYYKNLTAEYTQVGFGATINSIPTSVKFDSLDIVYRFPMNYGNQDSCNSEYAISVPGLGYYGQHKKRINEIDGWGTVKTPYGTFQALRLKTTLYTEDTVFITSIGSGYSVLRPTEIDYSWLANNEKVPVMHITSSVGAFTTTVSSISYPDSIRTNLLSNPTVEKTGISFTVFPNPANDVIIVDYLANNENVTLALSDELGNSIATFFNNERQNGQQIHSIDLRKYKLPAGIYSLQLLVGNNASTQKVIIK